jgi:hypothetical protein
MIIITGSGSAHTSNTTISAFKCFKISAVYGPACNTAAVALACGDLLRPRILFVYELDLLIDYLANKPVDRDVHPVTLLALGNKGVLKTWFSSKIK